MDIIHRLAADGKSVLVSSHVLHEVESLTPNIVLMNRGRLIAEGNVREIRDLIEPFKPASRRPSRTAPSHGDVLGPCGLNGAVGPHGP